MKKAIILVATLIALTGTARAQVAPPQLLNYQGVLRDSNDVPVDAAQDMVFEFYTIDANCGTTTNVLLVDRHIAANTGSVPVSNGLFNVGLGSGEIVFGAETSLLDVFRNYGTVWMQIGVAPEGGTIEYLCPRVRVHAAAYAQNAAALEGRGSSYFLDTSSNTQTKTGLIEAYGGVDLGAGSDDDLTAADVAALTDGVSNADGLHTHTLVAGADTLDGLDSTHFLDVSANAQVKAGDLSVGDLTLSGGDLNFGLGASVVGNAGALRLRAGDAATDDIILLAGNGINDGSITVNGGGALELRAGDGTFTFRDAAGTETAGLDAGGSLQLDGTLDVDGQTIALGAGGLLSNDGTGLTVTAGDADADDLVLHAGDDLTDGGISVLGDQSLEIVAGNGDISFTNGSTSAELMSLEGMTGDLTLRRTLEIGSGSDTDDDVILFDGAESLRWDESASRFQFTQGVELAGTLNAEAVRINGTSGDDFIYFNGGTEQFKWEDGDARFELSDELAIDGTLQVGSVTTTPEAFNRFGSGTPISGALNTVSDVLAADLELSGALYLDNTLYMQRSNDAGADGDQTIYFYDADSRTRNFIRWDDVRSDGACSQTGAVDEAFVFNISDDINTNEGWLFMQGADIEFKVDDGGNVTSDGSMTANGSCDVAEAFLGPRLDAGTVVVLDPERPEGVLASTAAYQAAVGVVSTRPGLLLGGPTADSYPAWKEMESIDEQLRAGYLEESERAGLAARRDALEDQLDSWTRGDLPVALVGRVPVKVDGSYGAILQGDYLTASDTPGHAMALDRPGPYFGIAMESFSGGEGEILVFLAQGWYGGDGPVGKAVRDDESVDVRPTATVLAPTQEVEANLQIVLDRGADDASRFSVFRNGENGLDSEVFRVDEAGNVYSTGSFRPAAMDVAEYHPVTEAVSAGDVLVMDRERPGSLRLGREAADPAVVGIVSSQPGVLMGSGIRAMAATDPELARRLEAARAVGDGREEARLWNLLEERFRSTHAAVALTGTVPVKVDAGYGAIRVGDMLTASPTPGHAMRADDPRPGTVLGKAMEPLEGGTGVIRIFVMLR